MELGTAIFSSVALICVVVLIVALRNKIRWRRFFLFTLVILIALGAGIYVFNQPFLWRGEIVELDGLKLGESESDLLFKKGTYARLCKTPDGKIEYAFLQEDYGERKYISVAIRDGRIGRIVKSMKGDYVYWDWRNGLTSSDDEERVRNKYGNEDFISSFTNAYRMYVWRKYNLMIGLTENRVSNVAVFDPQNFYKGPEWRNENSVDDECYDAKGNKIGYFDIYKPKP